MSIHRAISPPSGARRSHPFAVEQEMEAHGFAPGALRRGAARAR
jgi:hypothetical protein